MRSDIDAIRKLKCVNYDTTYSTTPHYLSIYHADEVLVKHLYPCVYCIRWLGCKDKIAVSKGGQIKKGAN